MIEETTKHPAFIRAEALSDPWLRAHFPKTTEEAQAWTAMQKRRALAARVIVVAQTRIICEWSAYIDAVPGRNHDEEYEVVLDHGEKLPEVVARALFPEFDEVRYAA